MQLIPSSSSKGAIATALASATCALISGHSSDALGAAAGKPGTWDFDTAVLYYAEDSDRVVAIEPVIAATRYFEDDKQFYAKLVVDSLTGASPTGATPSSQVQTFTRPSGKGSYEVAPGETPLDDTFKDTRGALTLNWSAPINSDWRYSTGLYLSSEFDYQSAGLNGSLTRYLNEKNTELTLGLSAASDTIKPYGNIPKSLSRVPNNSQADFNQAFANSRVGDSDTKSLTDVLLGVTQVINRRTLMQFNYSLSSASGYMTDPFKLLSVIDGTTGKNEIGSNNLPVYVYEQRPDSRTKHAFYWQTKYMLDGGDVIDGSYRFMTDDWGVNSHTIDLKYRLQFKHSYLEPHLRVYQQSEADFYKRYLLDTQYNATTAQATVENASADYRLGDMTGTTLGVKYAQKVGSSQEFSARLEYYVQSNSGDEGFGDLAKQELYPDTKALMVTLGYSF
jgi:hypothetical protein